MVPVRQRIDTRRGMATRTDISVVVVELVGGDTLTACLERLATLEAKVIVICRKDAELAQRKLRFPDMRFVQATSKPVPFLRQQGVELASTAKVALLEDTVLPDHRWLTAASEALSAPRTAAAGGPVTIDPSLPARYLALACAEFGRFHPDLIARLAYTDKPEDPFPATRLPGCNLAYRRAVLLEILRQTQHGLIETEVHESLQKRGLDLVVHSEMTVFFVGELHSATSLISRFNHGRLFAHQRVATASWSTRLSWFVKSAALPAMLALRALRTMRAAVPPTRWLTVAVWLGVLEAAWAAGESVGYLAGGGHSLERWQ